MTIDRDAELSALLDGALSTAEESALRDEIARVPELAARLEELAHVDAALRALPARPVPGDLRARLQAKLEAEAHTRPRLDALPGGAPARPSRRRAWMAGLGAAAAAAAAALVVVVGGPANDSGPAATGDLAVKPAGATASGAENDPLLPVVAETPVDPSPSVTVPRDAGSLEASAAIARVEPAPRRAPEPERESAVLGSTDTESSQLPLRVDPSRVAIEEPAPTTSSFEDAESAPAPATAGALTDSAPDQLALATPPLYVEVTDDEADALGELELRDATIVGVLDLLGELDELPAGAS